MPDVIMISAMAQNRTIGKDGNLPWHLPEDLKHFIKSTLNHPMVMGRKTFDSLHGLLPKRRHLVVTRNAELEFPQDVDVFYNINDAVEDALKSDDEIYIIGGAHIYTQAFTIANKLSLTVIEKDFAGDTFFPEIPDNWSRTECSETYYSASDKLPYRFEIWVKF